MHQSSHGWATSDDDVDDDDDDDDDVDEQLKKEMQTFAEVNIAWWDFYHN